MRESELNIKPIEEPPAMPPTRQGETSEGRAPGFLQTVREVIREHPGGFIPAALALVLSRGEFTKKE
jgi:hypothetical protein